MKYSEIIRYKKIIKNIIMIACYLLILGMVYITGYFIKNIITCLLIAILGGIIFLPLEMHLEKQIKEMEILLKLEKLLDRENNKPKQ